MSSPNHIADAVPDHLAPDPERVQCVAEIQIALREDGKPLHLRLLLAPPVYGGVVLIHEDRAGENWWHDAYAAMSARIRWPLNWVGEGAVRP